MNQRVCYLMLIVALSFSSCQQKAAPLARVSAIPTAASAAENRWDREPTSFAGIPFGTPWEEVQKMASVTDCIQSPDAGIFCMKDLTLRPDLTVKVYLLMKDGKVERATFTFSPGEYEFVRDVFTEKYGPVMKTETSTLQNAMGAKFDNESVFWKGKAVSAGVSKYTNKTTEGLAFVGPLEDVSLENQKEKKTAAGVL